MPTVCVCNIEVRYAETDQMGVVHHSHYPVYFEQGRTTYFQNHLLPYQDFEAQGLIAPVLSYQVELLGRLCYGDVLRLETYPCAFKGLSVTMGYRGYRQQDLVVTGESRHALMGKDLKALHPRRLPECFFYLQDKLRQQL